MNENSLEVDTSALRLIQEESFFNVAVVIVVIRIRQEFEKF